MELQHARDRTTIPRLHPGLWLVSGLALTGAMVLSMLYGLRTLHHWPWLDIPWMRAWHGTGNALGACLAGVVAHELAVRGRSLRQ